MQRKWWRKKKIIFGILFVFFSAYMGWRMLRPMSIFTVSDPFAFPIAESQVPGLPNLKAETCGACHKTIYQEWKASFHSHAWSDPFFQAYNRYDDYEQICLNCHTPLQNQQPNLVKGHKDAARHKPILEKNPDYSPDLREEGVTCAVCHVKEGKIHGPFGSQLAPHPTVQNPIFKQEGEVCKRCHQVKEDRWDTFFYDEGPCGTYEDLEEIAASGRKDIGCYSCHMPGVNRPLVPGFPSREGRAHLWRGGHDPDMVKKALKITFERVGKSGFLLALVNEGAGHRLPTGAPMRYLTVSFRSFDSQEKILEEESHKLQRNVIWRPFIVGLLDSRLEYLQPRSFRFDVNEMTTNRVEVILTYHIMSEVESQAIGASSAETTSYELYKKEIIL